MTDEEALVLTLLDRPGDADTCLVYADWLEEHGQDDLAQWLRLRVALWQHRGDARQHEARLGALRQAHLGDWVELAGVVLTWASALALLRRRLVETAAWCADRDLRGFRSPELLPRAVWYTNHYVSGDEDLWHLPHPGERTRFIHTLANRRAAAVAAQGLESDANLAAGRLLLFEPDRAQFDSAVRIGSGGYLDGHQAPPWDTWLIYFDDGAVGRRRTQRHWEAEWIVRREVVPGAFASYLAAWVPADLVDAVAAGQRASADPPFAWAEDIECELTLHLREAGWWRPAAPVHAVARRQQGRGRVVQQPTPLRADRPLAP
jgi:uncharacterized protein (TIGR02996 family)